MIYLAAWFALSIPTGLLAGRWLSHLDTKETR